MNHIEIKFYYMKKLAAFVRCSLICACLSAGMHYIGFSQEVQQNEFTKFVRFHGRVVDEHGNGISEVIVLVYGTSGGGISGKNGDFEIPVPEGQSFGLYCWHPKYIIKNYPVDCNNLNKKICLVLKETNCKIDFVREIYSCSPDEIDKKLPIPKIKLKEEEIVDWFDDGIPLYPGGIENLCNRYKQEVQNQFKLKTKGKPLRGIYHGTFLIDKNGLMDLTEIEERVTKKQEQEMRDFFRRFGQWKPSMWRGKPVERKFDFVVNFKLDFTQKIKYRGKKHKCLVFNL